MAAALLDTEDLIDAHEVARLAGLRHASSVSSYLQRYPDMPRPVIELGGTRPRLWLRGDIEAWVSRRPARTEAGGDADASGPHILTRRRSSL